MKILVPVKRVVDANVHIRVKKDESGVDTANLKMSINPFCEIALEEAVRLKEAGTAEDITAVTIGDDDCSDVLKTALAMGADRAIHVVTDKRIFPLGVARILAEIVRRDNPQLVMLGKLSIDDENNQTGQMLAGLLNWAQGTFVSAIRIENDGIEVVREVDAGLETLTLTLPAVITADLRLNEPRYIRLPELMKAKKKPVETVELSALNIDTAAGVEVLRVTEPPARAAGVRVGSVDELVEKLRSEARVI